ncbi:MAG: type III pantothenate kinase [Chloroflexi bacterium]|nr:type III pantothenate kinase [Chloroflexota bacterium]
MLLAVDIGNSNISLGVFQGEELRATWRIATDVNKQADEYEALFQGMLSIRSLQPSCIKESVICSVVPPLTGVFQEFCERYLGHKPLIVGMGVKTGIRINYESPRDVGADRVADAVAAYHKYGGPVIVVDFGTATVIDAISGDGVYLGGAIAPGIGIAAEALFARTSKLHRVELLAPPTAIGKNTVDSMQSGLIFGYVGLVEELVRRFQKELGEKARVIATGGLASIIAKETSVLETVDPNLTLDGLRLIHQMNVS